MKKLRKPEVTMRFGAAHNHVIVDGVPFDRNDLNRGQQSMMRHVVVEALGAAGVLTAPAPSARRYRRRKGDRA